MREDEREDERDDEEREEQRGITGRVTRRPIKPNPYNYYQKLVQDFQSLDKELQAAASAQDDLHSKVDALQAQHQASDREHLATQYKQWEREREAQIETIVKKSVEIESLHSKVDELDAQELRLLAEIQVLQEKQQEEIQTEAFRINELVHTKTHLFEAELAKGRMDLEFIAQLVKKTHSHSYNERARESAREKESIHAIAEEIQLRRRREFDLAAKSLNARLLSFEQEKEALSKKANDIRTRKQRALQILSTNQQEALKTFFSSAPTSDSHAKRKATDLTEESTAAPPQLDFSSILASLNQSGAQVEQIQSARNEKLSARKTMEEALHEAQATLAVGEKRIEALQKIISDRKRDAEALNIFPREKDVKTYDGKMGIESYAPVKYELVYFIRGLVFSWIDRSAAEAESEPDMELLESEVQRWEVTHSVVEQEDNAHLRYQLAISQMTKIIDEVVSEIAADIHHEFRSDCSRVRETIGLVFRDVFFAKTSGVSNAKPQANGNPSKNSASSSPVLAADMFKFAFEQLQSTRKRQAAVFQEQTHERVQFLQLLTQPKKMVAVRRNMDGRAPLAPSESPKKKRFGFFSSSKAGETVSIQPHAPTANVNTTALSTDQQQLSVVNEESLEMIKLRLSPIGTQDSNAKIAVEKQFWQQMLVEIDKIVVPSTFSHSSCVEISSDASCCVVGTTGDELLMWDLQHQPALLLRSHVPPPKSIKSSISRIVFSANKTQIITLNQLKVIYIWSVNRVSKGCNTQQQQHSIDCFSSDDPQKLKPQPLELLMELHSDSLLRPGVSEAVKQLIPTEKSSPTILPPQFLSTNWFSTTSLLGEQPSVICGISSGDILKSNIGAPGQWFDAEVAAKFDAPIPSDVSSGLRLKNVKREFFCGHKHPVLFVKCLHSSKASTGVKLLSIDRDGMVLEWEYDSKQFSGFGWFTPVRRNRLDLQPPTSSDTSPAASQKGTTSSNTEKKQGEILQIAATADEKRVVLMVFFENPVMKKPSNSGRLVFYQLLLTPAAEPIHQSPVRIQLEFTGNSPPPRFALSTVFPSGKGGRGSGHILFVLMNNSVQIMSLDTGEKCCALIALQQKSEPSLVFNSIAVSARCMRKEKLHCCMAVAGDHHNKILLYRFKQHQQR